MFPESSAAMPTSPNKREDRVYQVMTVAAIVLVLCTLWVF